MDALVVHEWTTQGSWPEPVRRVNLDTDNKLQEDILEDMETRFGWHRDAIEAALAAHHVSSQVATTYHLLEYAKQRKRDVPQNPVWKVGKKKGKDAANGCSLQ